MPKSAELMPEYRPGTPSRAMIFWTASTNLVSAFLDSTCARGDSVMSGYLGWTVSVSAPAQECQAISRGRWANARQDHGEDAAASAGEGVGDIVVLRDGGLGCHGDDGLQRMMMMVIVVVEAVGVRE